MVYAKASSRVCAKKKRISGSALASLYWFDRLLKIADGTPPPPHTKEKEKNVHISASAWPLSAPKQQHPLISE